MWGRGLALGGKAPGGRGPALRRRRGRCTLALVVLALGLATAPSGLQAGLLAADTAAGYGLGDELAQLGSVREQIVRRRALRHALAREIGALTPEIGSLHERLERGLARLRADRRQLRALERTLDRIVPRLVARERALHERRSQAASALADLASWSRRGDLDPTIRARTRAISPALLDLLRTTDVPTAALDRQRDRATRLQGRLEREVPVLQAEALRLRQRHARAALRREVARDRAARLDQELRRLSDAAAGLGRLLLAVEAAHAARMAPQASQPASGRERLAPSLRVASVRGRAAAARLAEGVRAQQPSMARVAAASSPELRALGAPRVGWPARPVAGQGANVGAGPIAGPGRMVASRGTAPAARAMPVAGLAALSVAGQSSRVPAGQLPGLEPIRPSLDAVATRFHDDRDGVGIAIAATPGQPVAAPEGGRIVFADAFKSYGLLLIIAHDNEYHSLLWGFSRLRVGLGDRVRGGQIIGVMDIVDGKRPQLHVELRRNGRPVNPLPWLASSSSKVRG